VPRPRRKGRSTPRAEVAPSGSSGGPEPIGDCTRSGTCALGARRVVIAVVREAAAAMTPLPHDLRRHPLNDGFAWRGPAGPFAALTAEQADAFDQRGFFVVEDAFGDEELAPVLDQLDRSEARAEAYLRSLEDGRLGIAEADAITFTPNLAHRKPALRSFVQHPVLLGLCRDLVGADVDLYWDQAVYKKPQKPRRFPWHQDNGYTFVEPQYYLTCWVALTDATVENGCPQVAPGLHRFGTLHHDYVEPLGWQVFDEPPSAEVAPVGRGGIVVFTSLTPHLTGPNTTGEVRKAYIVQYAPAGAVVVAEGDHVERRPVGEQPHTFPVLRDGRPIEEPVPDAGARW
jgi:phytanoyl-CoA hydroxylase